MLDVNFIRQNSDEVKQRLAKKAFKFDVEEVLKLDEEKRALLSQVEELRQQRNIAAKDRDIEKGKEIKEKLGGLESALREKEEEYKKAMYHLPNVPLEGLPEGDESNNKVLRKIGEPKKFDFKVRDHIELGEMLDIIDIQRASKVSGSRFAYLKNEGALLEIALVQFALETLVKEGFSPVIPPVLIKKEITEGLGYWHGNWHQNYYLVQNSEKLDNGEEKQNDLYLVGTAEHALVPMHAGETFKEEETPKKYAGFSPSFRREAGAYGKDVRGILRVHQFEKVEMVAFVKPEDDETERRKMLSIAEGFVKSLGLPYQVLVLATGDISFPAAETMDIETWIPSQEQYRETHSISTTTDFQSRRLDIKFKKKDGGVGYVHILNGTALALGRIIIAILENYQQEDGTVIIPEVLRKYTGFVEIKPR